MVTHCMVVPPEEHYSHCTSLFPQHNSTYSWISPQGANTEKTTSQALMLLAREQAKPVVWGEANRGGGGHHHHLAFKPICTSSSVFHRSTVTPPTHNTTQSSLISFQLYTEGSFPLAALDHVDSVAQSKLSPPSLVF